MHFANVALGPDSTGRMMIAAAWGKLFSRRPWRLRDGRPGEAKHRLEPGYSRNSRYRRRIEIDVIQGRVFVD